MEQIDFNNVGKWIKEERKRQKISQKELAIASFITPQEICGMEKGRRNPSVLSLLSILKALGYRVDVIKEQHEV